MTGILNRRVLLCRAELDRECSKLTGKRHQKIAMSTLLKLIVESASRRALRSLSRAGGEIASAKWLSSDRELLALVIWLNRAVQSGSNLISQPLALAILNNA